jgi:hypothetical protein
MGIEARLPNFFGYEQTRLDGIGPAFMPFAQSSVIAALMAIPRAARQDGRLFKAIIRSRSPALSRLPLVKGGERYPFGWPPLPAYLLVRFRGKLRRSSSWRDRFLDHVEESVREIVGDPSTRNAGWYDMPRLREAVDAYYGGDRRPGPAIDWWLSLEAWRRAWQEGS